MLRSGYDLRLREMERVERLGMVRFRFEYEIYHFCLGGLKEADRMASALSLTPALC